MARWKLIAPHYLYSGDTKWEYSEVDRTTGRPKRTQFLVPRLIDPNDQADWTEILGKDDGMVIVCHPGKGQGKDISFTDKDGNPGEPTPDMVPIDEEAQAISAKYSWSGQAAQLPGSYGDALLDDLTKEVASLRAQQPAGGQVEGMTELLTAMAAMMKQNQEMMGMIAGKQPALAPAPSVRR